MRLKILCFIVSSMLTCSMLAGQPVASVASSGEVGLVIASGPEGHLSIGLDAVTDTTSDHNLVPFSRLGEWEFDPEVPLASPPASVAGLDGRDVALAGFMFPLQEGETVRAFLLTATTQTCCYGPRPQYNQFILVETSEPIPFIRLKPCMVRGKFVIEPRPADGYIFRLEAHDCKALQVIEQPIVAGIAKTPAAVLTWAGVETLKSAEGGSELATLVVPASLSLLVGKEVALTGNLINCVVQASGTWLTVASHPWDGCCYGRPPEFADSVRVRLATGSIVPQHWHKQGRFQGVLREFAGEPRVSMNAVLWLDQTQILFLADSFIGGRMASFPASPMVTAAANNDIPGIRLLLRAGVPIDARDSSGNSPVHLAAGGGDVAMLTELLAQGASGTVRNRNHETPLHRAADGGHREAAVFLLEHGVEPDPIDNAGFSPLARAIANQHSDTAQILLEKGARIDLVNAMGLTPLALAVRYRQPELVKLLVQRGAALEPIDKQGQTPLAYALGVDDKEMVELLRQLGAKR